MTEKTYIDLLDVYEGLTAMLALFDKMSQREEDCLLAVTMLSQIEKKIIKIKEKKLK